jgi:DNA-binding ferritin-like protein
MNVITPLIQFQQQLRIFHWQTQSYAQHKAFGEAYEDIDEHIDTFVEAFMGAFGKSKPTNTFNFSLEPLDSEETVHMVIGDFEDYLRMMNSELDSYPELLNIRDEIMGTVQKLKYLLTLK